MTRRKTVQRFYDEAFAKGKDGYPPPCGLYERDKPEWKYARTAGWHDGHTAFVQLRRRYQETHNA